MTLFMKNLKNRTAAINLSKEFIQEANSILDFPYRTPEYKAKYKLKNIYRSIKIKNFLMFYAVNENEKIITIVRFLY